MTRLHPSLPLFLPWRHTTSSLTSTQHSLVIIPHLHGCILLLAHSTPCPVTHEELIAANKRSRSASAPSPLDQIPYQVFKKCSSLVSALLDLFNTILTERVIPTSWKVAVFRLIGKSAASEDPHCPERFRPIALTPSVSKLLSGILKRLVAKPHGC